MRCSSPSQPLGRHRPIQPPPVSPVAGHVDTHRQGSSGQRGSRSATRGSGNVHSQQRRLQLQHDVPVDGGAGPVNPRPDVGSQEEGGASGSGQEGGASGSGQEGGASGSAHVPSSSQPIRRTPGGRKPARESKKDIPPYKFDDAETRMLIYFVKDHPQIYKQQKGTRKGSMDQLWMDFAREHIPDAHWMAVRKLYEDSRTTLCRTLSLEARSGQSRRTQHIQRLFENWGFLRPYISHRRTRAAHEGDGNESSASASSSGCSRSQSRRRTSGRDVSTASSKRSRADSDPEGRGAST